MSAKTKRLIAVARAAHTRSMTMPELCKAVGVSRATAYRLVAELYETMSVYILTDDVVEIADYGILDRDRM
jgi:DNA-binding IclR family transcriptional regulator